MLQGLHTEQASELTGFRSSALLCVRVRELTLFLMKTFSIIQLNEVAVMISKSNPKKKKKIGQYSY